MNHLNLNMLWKDLQANLYKYGLLYPKCMTKMCYLDKYFCLLSHHIVHYSRQPQDDKAKLPWSTNNIDQLW